MKTLDEVREYLSKVSYIDLGGCGISALAMIRWINKNMRNKKVLINFTHNSCSYYNDNKDYFENGKGKVCAHSHIVLRYKRKYFDCRMEYKLKDLDRILKTNHEEILLEAINNIGTWNDKFQRKYVKKIQKDLDIDLSDVLI